jgi:hypothetical protein
MDKELNSVHERIQTLIDYFNKGNKTAFGKETGILPGVLASIVGGRMSKPSFELLQKMINRFPEINGDWVLMGRGKMLHLEVPSETRSWRDYHEEVRIESDLEVNRSFIASNLERHLKQYEEDEKQRAIDRETIAALVEALERTVPDAAKLLHARFTPEALERDKIDQKRRRQG